MPNYLKFHKNQLYRRDAPYLTYKPKHEFIGHRNGGQKVCFLTKIRINWYVQNFNGIPPNRLSACEKHNKKTPQQWYENDFINWKPRLHQTTHKKGLFWSTFLAICLRSLNTLISHYTPWPWRWRQHVPPKHWYRATDHTASQPRNTTIWTVTAMKIGNLGIEAVLSTAKMTATDSSETLVNYYQTTRRHIPRVSHFYSYCRENLGSRTINIVLVCICSSTTLSGRRNVEWLKEDALKRMLMVAAMMEFKVLFQHNTGRGRHSDSIRNGRSRLRKLARKIPP